MTTNTGHRYISHNINTNKFVVQMNGKELNVACDSLVEALDAREAYLLAKINENAAKVTEMYSCGNYRAMTVYASDVVYFTELRAGLVEEEETH